MSIISPTETLQAAAYDAFATSWVIRSLSYCFFWTRVTSTRILPLYTGPLVKVRLAGREYQLSKALLCKQSSYFAATFDGNFQEGVEQSTTLTEIDGVVSVRGFEMLVQWLYLGRINFGDLVPEETISTVIEFLRLADMCSVTGMETSMAERVKAIILAHPAPPDRTFGGNRNPDTNTYCLTTNHVISASNLPTNHPIRSLLAKAVVEGYLRYDDHKFVEESQKIANFAFDLLKEVRTTIKSTVGFCDFVDPISGLTLKLS